MSFGTLDRSPPPFFRQGPSAFSKLVVCAALAVFLMAADSRFALVRPLRNVLATALLPVVHLLNQPVRGWQNAQAYWQGLDAARGRENAARADMARLAMRSAQVEQLSQENARLRELLGLRPALTVVSHAAEVLYEAPDPYSRKIFINLGSQHGIQDGAPVINEAGVLGQVTHTYLLTAEVTLLGDKDSAIPVLNTRTQHRGAAFGSDDGSHMELRFVAANEELREGDVLHTSGVDGVYPPGLAVARISAIDRRGDAGFARIELTPLANPDHVRHVLVLDPLSEQMPARPEPAPAAAPASAARKNARR